ncbi:MULTISPECIES: family 2 glycosyl transferase [unclassified Clostridium]|uniref:family 2 glycosyl transferase n=1 Tax=unclassified Clostridium TaxID=2614128 RepID=UPI001897BD7D|nr:MULTISPECIES: family 2 glycosyl transferase [unclassified Clostridium]
MSIKVFLKRVLIITMIILIIISALYIFQDKKRFTKKTGTINFSTKTEEKNILVNKNGEWENFFVKGVNLGASKPGYFPNEYGVTKEEYLRWFNLIAEMNANTIRVYTILKPEFYEALYEFNKDRENPLYIIHGMWVNDNSIEETMNAYDDRIIKNMKRDITSLIDVVHGNAYIPQNSTHASGKYKYDISQYVLGFILGIEWEGYFVYGTDLFNEEITSYDGEYLKLEEGTPFEAFLAQVGDYAVEYESEKYEEQRIIAFANWPPTDPLIQPYEPEDYNDIAQIDVDKIKGTEKFETGMFASYHIYPNYPNFLNMEPEYTEFIDDEGKNNSYRAYLKKINNHHEIPVIVTEFGVPSSRGIAHFDSTRGFDQGNLSENEQAEIIPELYEDIVKENMAGAIVFSWQDEWFKTSWNTNDLIDTERTAYWLDEQTNEQFYGLLSFDTGEEHVKSYPDGNFSEWENSKAIINDDEAKLYMDSDESYIYFKLNIKDLDLENDSVYIPIDVTPNSGAYKSSLFGLEFDRGVDFIIEIKGKENSRVYIHDYYDYLRYRAKSLPSIQKFTEERTKDMDNFNYIYQYLMENVDIYIKETKQKLIKDEQIFESGKLIYGNGNPNSDEYNSLADFFIVGDEIEIRIPWQLLNFYDPSKQKVAGDYCVEGLNPKPIRISKIYSGINVKRGEELVYSSNLQSYSWKEWNTPSYHERLKPAYYSVQKMFEDE